MNGWMDGNDCPPIRIEKEKLSYHIYIIHTDRQGTAKIGDYE